MKALVPALAAMAAATISPVAAQQNSAENGSARISGITDPRDAYPDISPDGQRIVFQSNRSGNWQLWLSNIDGGDLRRLTFTETNDTTPVWSPNGSTILFARDSANDAQRDLFVLDVREPFDPKTQTAKRIIGGNADDMHPEWAMNGDKIIFNRIYADESGADIVIADADGANLQTMETDEGWNTYAAMVSDGSRVVWRGPVMEQKNGEPFSNSEILSARPDGSDLKRLTDDAAFDGRPTVSPDNSMIAFASDRSDGIYNIFVMPLAGGEPRQITFGQKFHYTQPAWSPDGKSLAAFRWYENIGHIVMISIDGTEQ